MSPTRKTPPGDGESILIVDDHDELWQQLARAFARRGPFLREPALVVRPDSYARGI